MHIHTAYSYAKQHQQHCNKRNIMINCLPCDSKVHKCKGCASVHTQVHKYNIVNVFMTRYITSEGVIDISVHIELQCSAILQFRSHSSITGPYICSGWVFQGVSVYLVGHWGHILTNNNAFSCQSVTAAEVLILLLPVEELHQNQPQLGPDLWTTSMSDLSVATPTFSLKISQNLLTQSSLDLFCHLGTLETCKYCCKLFCSFSVRFNLCSCSFIVSWRAWFSFFNALAFCSQLFVDST